MHTHVLFLQGGGVGTYEADSSLVTALRTALGPDHGVVYPKMPNEGKPEYAAWKRQIAHELAAFDSAVIGVGHSLGGSVWLKYLAEEVVEQPITGLFLLAAPYWGTDDWCVDEYILHEDFASQLPNVPLFLYHSRDDDVVPFTHLALYAERMPQATIRAFDRGGHQLHNHISDVAADIAGM